MIDIGIDYPEGINTTQEEREFDSFLLSYVSEQAVRQRSPKIRVELDQIDKAWQEHSARKSAAH